MAEYGSQAVVWQTAVNPVVALELIDSGAWTGTGVLGPEALPADPFLELLTDYGSPWACEERTPTASVLCESRVMQNFLPGCSAADLARSLAQTRGPALAMRFCITLK
jgi:hypothetical protein